MTIGTSGGMVLGTSGGVRDPQGSFRVVRVVVPFVKYIFVNGFIAVLKSSDFNGTFYKR